MENINKNDDRIINLKKEIEKKSQDLNSKKIRFSPLTNCVISFKGNSYNLHVLNKEQLTNLLVGINMFLMSAKDLGYDDSLCICGFKISEWMQDIKTRIEILNNKEEEKKLEQMKSKLIKLLSSEKRTELELDEIEAQLK